MSDLPEDRLKILLSKYLQDTLTMEERLELSDLAMKVPKAWEMLAQMRSAGQVPIEFQERQHAAMERGLPKIEATIRRRERSRLLRKKGIKWMIYGMPAAAVIGGVIFFTPSLWKHKPVNALSTPAAAFAVSNEIVPGGNKATLTLTNGRTIRLDSLKGGKLPEQEGVNVLLQDSGTIAYHAGNGTATAYNMLTIPRGGQYRVILPDGTKVWLNNVSSLRYPVAFTGKTREVQVTGEAFFDVVKDAAKPFIVKVNDIDIHVLGTQFCVSAYTKEKVRTALLKGAVKVTGADPRAPRREQARILKPGQTLESNTEHDWTFLPEVDTADAIGWTRGNFVFRNAPLSEILKNIARWYDVDPDLRGMTRDPVYELSFPRNLPLSEVLSILAKGGKFRIEGRKLIVN